MRRLPPPSVRTMVLALTLLASGLANAQSPALLRSYLEVSPSNREELSALLDTLERSLNDATSPAGDSPVVLILHGDEASSFTRQNYAANRRLADRVALLDAYRLVDVRMCETWMSANGVGRQDLLPFIDTVPYAPEEIRRLEADGYRPYGSVNL